MAFMEFTPAELESIRAAFGDAGRRLGHRPTAGERARVYAAYRRLREAHYGPVPAGERAGGPRNSLAAESPLARRIFGG